jgi:hypothetical protein
MIIIATAKVPPAMAKAINIRSSIGQNSSGEM